MSTRTWTITDFKSLGGATVDLDKLTLLTGGNSSGKSSLIQSLLFLAQNMGDSTSVVMNGPLVRLGAPKDAIRTGQETINISCVLGDLTLGDDVDVDSDGPASVEMTLGASDGGNRLAVRKYELVREDGSVAFSATSGRAYARDVTALREQMGVDATVLRITAEPGKKRESRTYLILRGIRPISIVIHRSASDIKTQYVRALSLSDSSSSDEPRRTFFAYAELSRLVPKQKFLQRITKTLEISSRATESGPLNRWTSRDLSNLPPEAKQRLAAAAASVRSRNEYVTLDIQSLLSQRQNDAFRRRGVLEAEYLAEHELTVAAIQDASDQLASVGLNVQYLGPLRDEPRVVHSAWDQKSENLPVGYRGELTAEVLSRNKEQVVTYYNWLGDRHRRQLAEAVSEWCEYFGIADRIEVTDHGKLGRGVQLQVNGVLRDLTTIGVGASQLLPVIVAGLMVPAGSLFLTEQPELHLHPALQSKLADFFLRARPDVHFVIETHSEYLVTRLRRRVAERKASPEDVSILFAEQTAGITAVKKLDLDAVGDLSSWPAGFFDTQDADSMHILRAMQEQAEGQD